MQMKVMTKITRKLSVVADFTDAMDDDFNVQNGIVFALWVGKILQYYSEKQYSNSASVIINTLRELSGVLVSSWNNWIKDDEA